MIRAWASIVIVVIVSACAPATTLSQAGEPSYNPGRRLDLVIADITNEARVAGDVRAITQSVWSSSPSLRSWFTMTERVTDPANTVFLSVSVDSAQTSSDSATLPVVGTVTVYTTSVTASVSLSDAVSGLVLASATASGAETGNSYGAGEIGALRKALQAGLYEAVQSYSGE